VSGKSKELKNLLSGVFYFGSVSTYLKFDRSRNLAFYVAALLMFALGLMSKTVIVQEISSGGSIHKCEGLWHRSSFRCGHDGQKRPQKISGGCSKSRETGSSEVSIAAGSGFRASEGGENPALFA
jgi:hypothetical protein